jgi:DNA-directed RNA polymerase specialized sigma24 family protein
VAGEQELLDYDDAKLLSMVREGDIGAFGRLRERHGDAARRLARILVSEPAEIDDVVNEAFDLVLAALKRGGGPVDGFRPYVLTATRRVCASRTEGQGLGAEGEPAGSESEPSEVRRRSDPGRPFLDPATSVDKLLVVGVFLSLPERFSAVLWHLEIEQETAGEIAPLFGLSSNGLTVLERRARAAFRQTYLDAYSAQLEQAACMSVADMLGGYLRYALADGETAYVAAHLSECASCRAVYTELADLGATLRTAVAPVVLGSAAAAYLPGDEISTHTAVDVVPAGAVETWAAPTTTETALVPVGAAGLVGGLEALGLAGADAGGADGGAGAGVSGLPESGTPGPRPHRAGAPISRMRVLVGVGALALAALIGVPIALALTAGHKTTGGPITPVPTVGVSPQSPSANAASSPPAHKKASAKAKPASKPSPAVATPVATSTPSPPPTQSSPPPSPSPSASQTPKAAAKLAATINVYSFGGGGETVFSVTNTGNAATGALTATISLPSGSSMGGGGHGHGHGNDWTCSATSSGATCTASALSAGHNSNGGIWIQLSGSGACGQSVSLSVKAGSASTSAQSPETIQCGGPGGPGGGDGNTQRAAATHLLT